MDTVFVYVTDTLIDTVQSVSTDTVLAINRLAWWEPAASIALSASALGSALFALFSYLSAKRVYKRSQQLEDRATKRQIFSDWAQLAKEGNLFWDALKHAYKIYKQEIKWSDIPPDDKPPAELEDLFDTASVPSGLESLTSAQRYWKGLSDTLKGNQQWLYKFMNRVHTKRRITDSIIVKKASSDLSAQQQWESFCNARAAQSNTLESWAMGGDLSYLARLFASDRITLIALTWLELSLVNVEGKKWLPRPNLFRLTLEVNKLHTEPANETLK